jgi:hypothetical protein
LESAGFQCFRIRYRAVVDCQLVQSKLKIVLTKIKLVFIWLIHCVKYFFDYFVLLYLLK